LIISFDLGDGILRGMSGYPVYAIAGHQPIRLWLVQTDVSDGLFSSVYGADCGHPSWLGRDAPPARLPLSLWITHEQVQRRDLCNGGVDPVAEMNDMSGKGS